MRWLVALMLVACSSSDDGEPLTIDLRGDPEIEVTKTFGGPRTISIVNGAGLIVEGWVEDTWIPPRPVTEDFELEVQARGTVTMTVWTRGAQLPPVARDRSLAWFDAAILDGDISFAKLLAAISSDGHGGALLERWFGAFAAGPGAGRATFAQFLDGIRGTQGTDPTKWNLAALPFKVTGVHNRVDLAAGDHCGELRVSVASTHATFSPVHFIFLFRQPPRTDDVTPDGVVHCRGTARMWARLSTLPPDAFRASARALLATGVVRARFLLAESVELSISPWQWRQWTFGTNDTPSNPALFQTIDVARVNAPGPVRDAFLAAVTANVPAIASRTWAVPAMFRGTVAEVQPNEKATLVDLSPVSVPANLPHALGMIGCPRCHTDDADFVQTGIDRKPSPFYDKELDARAARLDALGRGEVPDLPPFGPLQSLP
ncbi:MAG: hypothetical protein M4D80_16915 [Myxococcota bacterium]|nr:hypothetical protein [Myxococcota bacterium]